MFAPGETALLTTDGDQRVTIERSVGGGDYIVRTSQGRRFAVSSRQLRKLEEQAAAAPEVVLKGGEGAPQGDDTKTEGDGEPTGGGEEAPPENPEIAALREQLLAAETSGDQALAANLRMRIERIQQASQEGADE